MIFGPKLPGVVRVDLHRGDRAMGGFTRRAMAARQGPACQPTALSALHNGLASGCSDGRTRAHLMRDSRAPRSNREELE